MIRLLFILVFSVILFSCGSSVKKNPEEEKAKTTLQNYLKRTLRDPNSFVVYSEKIARPDNVTYEITIDYGAKNGYGGMERTTEKYKVIGEFVIKSRF